MARNCLWPACRRDCIGESCRPCLCAVSSPSGCQGPRVAAVGVVTYSHIELAILTEVWPFHGLWHCSVIQSEDELLTACNCSITPGGDADHPVVGRGGARRPLCGEIDVGGCWRRSKATPNRRALRVNSARDIQKRRQTPSRLHHSQHTALFGYEQPTVWGELHGRDSQGHRRPASARSWTGALRHLAQSWKRTPEQPRRRPIVHRAPLPTAARLESPFQSAPPSS